MFKKRIVVGVDGSTGAAAALRWAAAEALLREAELRVLSAYHRLTVGGQARPLADEETTAVIHEAVTQARSIAPDVEVRGVALQGYAVPVLLHAAEEATLLVVGVRGKVAFPGLQFDSVGGQVATHARSSVVVVRGRSGTDAGPVVVGVDDDAAGATIDRAFEEAALHGAPLLAVTAGSGASTADLDSQLDRWREKYPDVPVQREVVAGRPDKVLVERSEQAQMVVVGPRRHGFEGVMLGSVGTRLLQRAHCPVLIARP
jgi:nucleotide-binding universal stress UspA family protein